MRQQKLQFRECQAIGARLSEAFKQKRTPNLAVSDNATQFMRRNCLTNMNRTGVPLCTIQDICGNASLSQLQENLSVDPADKQKAIMSLRY